MPVLDIELSDSQFLRNCNTVFTELSQKSIREKDMRGKNQWSQFLVGLLGSFTKNNQRKPTLCREEIIKQGKAVCRIESMKELLEEEVVNCTTSLEREELNKWLPDQDKNETEIQQTGSQKAVSCQGNSYSSTDDMLNYFFDMMHMSPDLFSQSLPRAKGVCPDTPCLYSSPKLLKGESHSWCSKHFSRK